MWIMTDEQRSTATIRPVTGPGRRVAVVIDGIKRLTVDLASPDGADQLRRWLAARDLSHLTGQLGA